MDVPPIAGATPERPPSPLPSGIAPDLGRRLASIEAGLADLGERLDTLASSLEASMRTAVAEEVQSASADLRHTVSELGRLLVRDLGRLSKILAEHRDSIVADLRAPAPAPAAAPAADGPAPVAAAGGDEASTGADDGTGRTADEPGGDDDSPDTARAADGDGGDGGDGGERQRRTLLRRRQV